MKNRILALLLALVSNAFAAPADVTVACDIPLPLAGITSVRFYERGGQTAPFTYTLAKETATTSTATTGALVVTAVIAVQDDGVPHAFVARSFNGAPVTFPATTVVMGGESPDSNPILVTVKKGATSAPSAFRVTNVILR